MLFRSLFRGWHRDSNRVSVVLWGPVVKDQGGQMANGYRGRRGRRRPDGSRCPPTSDRRGAARVLARLASVCLGSTGCWRCACRSFCICFNSRMAVVKERSRRVRCVETRSSKANRPPLRRQCRSPRPAPLRPPELAQRDRSRVLSGVGVLKRRAVQVFPDGLLHHAAGYRHEVVVFA